MPLTTAEQTWATTRFWPSDPLYRSSGRRVQCGFSTPQKSNPCPPPGQRLGPRRRGESISSKPGANHNFTVSTTLAEARYRPSGEKESERQALICAGSAVISLPDATLQK